MSEAGRVEPFAIMVDGARTVDDFITPVTVYVSYTEIMVSLFGILFISGDVCIEYPMLIQFLSIPVEGSQYDTRVVTAAHHYAGTNTVQISDAGEKTVAAVGTRITPVFGISTGRDIVSSVKCFTGKSGEYGQIFVTFQYASLTSKFILFLIKYAGLAIVGFGIS